MSSVIPGKKKGQKGSKTPPGVSTISSHSSRGDEVVYPNPLFGRTHSSVEKSDKAHKEETVPLKRNRTTSFETTVTETNGSSSSHQRIETSNPQGRKRSLSSPRNKKQPIKTPPSESGKSGHASIEPFFLKSSRTRGKQKDSPPEERLTMSIDTFKNTIEVHLWKVLIHCIRPTPEYQEQIKKEHQRRIEKLNNTIKEHKDEKQKILSYNDKAIFDYQEQIAGIERYIEECEQKKQGCQQIVDDNEDDNQETLVSQKRFKELKETIRNFVQQKEQYQKELERQKKTKDLDLKSEDRKLTELYRRKIAWQDREDLFFISTHDLIAPFERLKEGASLEEKNKLALMIQTLKNGRYSLIYKVRKAIVDAEEKRALTPQEKANIIVEHAEVREFIQRLINQGCFDSLQECKNGLRTFVAAGKASSILLREINAEELIKRCRLTVEIQDKFILGLIITDIQQYLNKYEEKSLTDNEEDIASIATRLLGNPQIINEILMVVLQWQKDGASDEFSRLKSKSKQEEERLFIELTHVVRDKCRLSSPPHDEEESQKMDETISSFCDSTLAYLQTNCLSICSALYPVLYPLWDIITQQVTWQDAIMQSVMNVLHNNSDIGSAVASLFVAQQEWIQQQQQRLLNGYLQYIYARAFNISQSKEAQNEYSRKIAYLLALCDNVEDPARLKTLHQMLAQEEISQQDVSQIKKVVNQFPDLLFLCSPCGDTVLTAVKSKPLLTQFFLDRGAGNCKAVYDSPENDKKKDKGKSISNSGT